VARDHNTAGASSRGLAVQRLRSLDSCFLMRLTPAILGGSASEAEAKPVTCYR
jgi:hypothetical protein